MGDRARAKSGGGCYAPFRGGAGSPYNTMSPGPRPTSVPSGILIHPTVWPQYTNDTDRQTDRQTGQRCRSIGRTVNCNGRPIENTSVVLSYTLTTTQKVVLQSNGLTLYHFVKWCASGQIAYRIHCHALVALSVL